MRDKSCLRGPSYFFEGYGTMNGKRGLHPLRTYADSAIEAIHVFTAMLDPGESLIGILTPSDNENPKCVITRSGILTKMREKDSAIMRMQEATK